MRIAERFVYTLLLTACLLCVLPARAKTATKLEGTIVDQSGGIIPGADVTLYTDARVLTTKSDENGRFEFDDLSAGARYLEVSSPGFFPISMPITEKTPEMLSFTLRIGGGTHVVTDCTPPEDILPPAVSYEDRSGKAQLSGTVTDLGLLPLASTSLTLLRADLDDPAGSGRNAETDIAMKDRQFKQTTVAEMTTGAKGLFEFDNLEPGWYTLKAVHDGYLVTNVEFWISRDQLTKLAHLYLFPISPKCH